MSRRVLGSVLLLTCLGACASDPPQAPATPLASTDTPTVTSTAATSAAPQTASAPPPSSTALPASTSTQAPAPTYPTSTPTNELTAKLFAALASGSGNLFFSAASLRQALAMTALGARGTTATELAGVLGIDPDPAKNAANARVEREAWAKAGGKAELSISNRVWIDKTFTLGPSFAQSAQLGYGATPGTVDFLHAPDAARQTINTWVSTATKDKIHDLLPSGSVGGDTRMVLTNAIYFKGKWQNAFPKPATNDAPFQSGATQETVKMMHAHGYYGYAETADVRVAELPYKDSDLSMLVVLPKDPAALGGVEQALSGGEIDAWAKALSPTDLALSMPRFKVEWGKSLREPLVAMGVRNAFSDKADFSGLSSSHEGLAVSDVVQKAFVQVDETGTEAAAATGVVVRAAAVTRVTDFTVDRPFLVFLRNVKTGDVLFSGRIAHPGA